MSKKLYALTVKGKRSTWSFHTFVDPKYVDEWRADGIEIDEVCNIIPEWVVDAGLTKLWCFLQDCFHFKNPLA